MGRYILVIGEKVLLKCFYRAPNFLLISSTSAPKNQSKRGALFSECGGGYERLLLYGWVWKNKSQYTHYKKLDYTTGYEGG